MKIALPVVNGIMSQHFGHSEKFSIITIEDSKIVSKEFATPPPHAEGVIPNWLASLKVDLLLTGGIGPMAVNILNSKGVEVLSGIPQLTPDEVAEKYINGTLVSTGNSCDHH